MNFPKVVNTVIRESVAKCDTFEKLMDNVREEIKNECDRLICFANQRELMPSPYLSVFIDGCLEKGMDLCQNAAKYNNSGCHGAGISNAADALAAVKKLIYEEKSLDHRTLLKTLENNFEGFEELRHKLLECPKMGNNEDYVDGIACELMDAFAKNMNVRKNNRGGIFRAGTGSAMEYIWSARQVAATADGRKAYEPYGSSFSPSITARLNGPLSVIQSFTKYDMTNIINGGPLTMEVHDTTFRNDMGIQKIAQLVKSFIDLGGHQLQLNSINRERLLDAQKHPENYPNLIVRVWGWSGYFNELAPEYQQHIIRRTEFMV
jgi:formate C-acetyltransferase